MTREWLAYQDPEGDKHIYSGEWKEIELINLPQDTFFIANHNLSNCYYFKIKEKVDSNILEADIDELTKYQDDNFIISKEYYIASLADFKKRFIEFNVKKAIYSRLKLAARKKRISEKYEELCTSYKQKAFVYLVASKHFGVWMGATPEILIKRKGVKYETVSLAGTKKDAKTNWTNKEFEEQRIVTDFIKDNLNELKVKNLIIGERNTIFSGAVYHLKTKITFEFDPKKENDLISKLHPTPAVCGLPRNAAYQLIQESEPHQRKLYTGLIGWKRQAESKIYVNLRCMQVTPDGNVIFVGGGITPASAINSEWEETEIKAKTLI